MVNVQASPHRENRPLSGNQERPFSFSGLVSRLADQAAMEQVAGPAAVDGRDAAP